jgi:hypothetical protein
MNNLQNSANQRSYISASLSSRGKCQNQMKLQDPVTMTISAVIPDLCTTLILIVAGHKRIGRRILDHLLRKETQGPSIKDPLHTPKEAKPQIVAMVVAEVHTPQNPCTACTTKVKPIITPKIAPFSLKPSEKWSKNPLNLHTNHHSEK